eukprot:2861831-Pleurochrysis_carterae.AAC.1
MTLPSPRLHNAAVVAARMASQPPLHAQRRSRCCVHDVAVAIDCAAPLPLLRTRRCRSRCLRSAAA